MKLARQWNPPATRRDEYTGTEVRQQTCQLIIDSKMKFQTERESRVNKEGGGPIQLYRIGPHLTDTAFQTITRKPTPASVFSDSKAKKSEFQTSSDIPSKICSTFSRRRANGIGLGNTSIPLLIASIRSCTCLIPNAVTTISCICCSSS